MLLRRLASTLLVLLALALPAAAAESKPDFATWLAGLRHDALAVGIRKATLDKALAGVQPIPKVIELDRRQPETTLTFEQYIERVVNPGRVEKGRQAYEENRALLETIGARYGVQPRFIVALWGIETDFGRVTGGFHVVPALATLAYDGRRGAFFRKELLNALRIIDHGDVDADAMLGSWAGAMGQSQFMPSSFIAYAVDWNGDGRRDIWNTKADVFASIANYLAKAGWQGDEKWGRKVRLPAKFDRDLAGLDQRKELAAWQRLGVRRADGGALPVVRGMTASLVLPGGEDGPALLVYDNFRAVMRWNSSVYFATAVGYLADRIEGR